MPIQIFLANDINLVYYAQRRNARRIRRAAVAGAVRARRTGNARCTTGLRRQAVVAAGWACSARTDA